MKTRNTGGVRERFELGVIAASLLLVAGQAPAQEATEARADAMRKDLATPDSRIDAGIGGVSRDNRRFGEFTGLNREGTYGLLDLNLIRRADDTGTWFRIKGRNLGLDSRELRLDHERQGNWSYFLELNSVVRNEPLIVNTALQGTGTRRQNVVTVPRGGGSNVDLKLDHDVYSLGVKKVVTGNFEVRASFKQDEKRGERMYGRGTTGAPTGPGLSVAPVGVQEFLTEPIDRTTRLWEVVLSYADPKFQLMGGYSGSSFENRAQRLDVTGGSPLINPAINAFALPPSNDAHQFMLAGGYNFAGYSRTSFKLSRTLARQSDKVSVGPTLAGAPTSLDGKLVTTLAFADVTSRPLDRLDLTASLRFEDRDDQTPIAQYLTPATPTPGTGGFPFSTAGVTGFNKPKSLKQLKGNIEAGYQLADGYRLVAALEEDRVTRNVPVQFRRVAYREKTDETSARLELKRNMSETLNGSLALIHSDRSGSEYTPDTYNLAANTNQVNALIWADRKRDKLRLTADWIPDDQWSVQFIADWADDRYSGRPLGPRKGTASYVSGDATYALSDKWKLSAWVSQERTLAQQSTRTDAASPFIPAADLGMTWEARLRNATTAWGIGLKGRPNARLELGADLSTSTDTAEHGMQRLAGASGTSTITSLPDYFYRQLSLKLFAEYALERNSGIRADFVYDHRRTNDWTWQNYVYTDGTTVIQPTQENTSFVGVRYYYRWR